MTHLCWIQCTMTLSASNTRVTIAGPIDESCGVWQESGIAWLAVRVQMTADSLQHVQEGANLCHWDVRQHVCGLDQDQELSLRSMSCIAKS